MENKFVSESTGAAISRAAYIRELFAANMSRKEIAEKLDVSYHTVYSATNNLFNDVHPEGGAGVITSVPVARVNAQFEFVDGEGNVVETAEEAATIMRSDLVKELFEANVSRNDLAEYFEVKYATIYSATKGLTNNTTRGSKKVLVHPETGETISRIDYIRELYNKGVERKEIAKQLTIMTDELVDYAVVWAATKPAKEEIEEVVEAVESNEE